MRVWINDFIWNKWFTSKINDIIKSATRFQGFVTFGFFGIMILAQSALWVAKFCSTDRHIDFIDFLIE